MTQRLRLCLLDPLIPDLLIIKIRGLCNPFLFLLGKLGHVLGRLFWRWGCKGDHVDVDAAA